MRIYLSSRFSRRQELCVYREQLVSRGHHVTSSWLDEALDAFEGFDRPTQVLAGIAERDLSEIGASELFIGFTEEPQVVGHNRGGRHVEMGFALAFAVPVWIVGPRENVFCWGEGVRQFARWDQVLEERALATSGICDCFATLVRCRPGAPLVCPVCDAVYEPVEFPEFSEPGTAANVRGSCCPRRDRAHEGGAGAGPKGPGAALPGCE